MVFMENNTVDAKREGLNFTIEEMHAHQIEQASHYPMAWLTWAGARTKATPQAMCPALAAKEETC